MIKKDKEDNSRDYLFDNIKAILIILVVWGHLLASMREENDIIKSIYIFIFFFHMPAMVFVSGYFSKSLEKIRNTSFVTILLPYLMLNAINYVFKIAILNEEYFPYRFFNPNWGLWYLLTLFLWKFFLKDLLKIRYVVPLSFVFALGSGFSKEFSEFMTLGRLVCFLPFFLLGYYCTPENVTRIRRGSKLVSILLLVATGVASVFIAYRKMIDTEVFFLRSYYPDGEEISTMMSRLLIYVVALVMTHTLINLVTSKKTFLSYLGASTMTVYILHIFTVPLLEKLALWKDRPYLYLIYTVFMTALITFVYSRPTVKNVYGTIMDKLTGLLLKNET
jgi:fucose 4-O-acetylase-like acetyltransferase